MPFKFPQFEQRNKLEVRFVKMPEGWHAEVLRRGSLLFVGMVYKDFGTCLSITRNVFNSIKEIRFTLARSDGKPIDVWRV